MITDGQLIFFRGLCGYVWVNAFTLSPTPPLTPKVVRFEYSTALWTLSSLHYSSITWTNKLSGKSHKFLLTLFPFIHSLLGHIINWDMILDLDLNIIKLLQNNIIVLDFNVDWCWQLQCFTGMAYKIEMHTLFYCLYSSQISEVSFSTFLYRTVSWR